MSSNIAASIARRYLLSKKSHGAVGTISIVSVCALAVATAAIVCVLSVFNGFREIIGEKLDNLSPDVMVTPAKGKAFADADILARRIAAMPDVETATPTLTDNALIICNTQEMPVTLKGVVPQDYAKVTAIRDLIKEDYGTYIDNSSDPYPAILAIGTAARLRSLPDDGAILFAPKREGRVNLANPAASFLTDSIRINGIYRTDQQSLDADGVIVPIELARSLWQYDSEASAIEIRLRPGVDNVTAADRIGKQLGPQFVVKDRLRQQEMNFRMVSIEKWISFLLLSFILIIAGFNIISALSMLVLEKESALSTLSALGLPRNKIGDIFAWESIYVSLAGAVAGIILGVILCLLQMQFGIIKFGGDPDASIIPAYPVALQWLDIAATFGIVMLLGLITAAITAAFARSRIDNNISAQSQLA